MRYNDNGYEIRYLVLNEVMMKIENGLIFVVDVNLRGKYFEWFRGDGLCVLIFLGLMVYNKVLGGVLIYFLFEVM